MGSINRKIAKDIIKGLYPEDHTTKIVTYNNMFDGGLTFATVYRHEHQNKYEESPACHNVEIVWSSNGGMTLYGQQLLKD